MDDPADALFDLDPDDPRTPSQQIANAIRASILTGRLPAGERLPSQHRLARRYGVARETVKAALRVLDRERLVVSRQGSGVFVRARQGSSLNLETFLRSAFDRPHVTIDCAGFSTEALANTLTRVLGDVRTGQLSVTTFRLRIMIPDPTTRHGLPQPIQPDVDEPAVRRQLRSIVRRSTTRLANAVQELTDLGLARSATLEIRTHRLGPVIKLYAVNDERVLLGFYPVTEYNLTVKGESVALHHPSGWDNAVFHTSGSEDFGAEPQTSGPPFAEQSLAWFESVWSTIAAEYRP